MILSKRPQAVFLDRDGTINIEAGYIHNTDDLNLMPGAAAAIRKLNVLNIPVFLATNQTGPARGYYPESHIWALSDRLRQLLAQEDAYLDAYYYCPHLAEGIVPEYSFACNCRKPEPGMLLRAEAEHGIVLEQSYMVGDKATDVEVGQRVNAKTVLLESGFGESVISGTYQWTVQPTVVKPTIVEAIDWIIADLGLV
jgi:D-glycero-D-manno-heptose 1,7-bisphosphate phosphatase